MEAADTPSVRARDLFVRLGGVQRDFRHRADPGRVAVVPFGANMDTELSDDEAEAAVAARPGDACRLLFIGVDWERKGGDYAVAVAGSKRTPPASRPRSTWSDHGRRVKRFRSSSTGIRVHRQDLGGRPKRASRAHAGSTFRVLPARADCSPVVLNEAAAHALPALASDVGGTPTIVRDEVSGKLFSSRADLSDYRDFVLRGGPSRRATDLPLGAPEEYRSRLNWRAPPARPSGSSSPT